MMGHRILPGDGVKSRPVAASPARRPPLRPGDGLGTFGAMKKIAAILLLALMMTAALAEAVDTEGTLRVFLILSQRSGPNMLNKVQGDISATQPVPEEWGRWQTLTKTLTADTYVIDLKNVKACHFKDCVPCPDRTREFTILAGKTRDEIFRFRAKYDRGDKKWVCR
jgi:hypothetical protein